jgi:CheY-specific phosphatase CheX/anti-anti-sigma regulatory factor
LPFLKKNVSKIYFTINNKSRYLMVEPILIDDIAQYFPEGTIKDSVATELAELLKSDKSRIESLGAKAILMSFKNVDDFTTEGLAEVIKAFRTLGKGTKLTIGFSDYTDELYEKLKPIYDEEKISLFKNSLVATLFLGLNKISKKSDVIVYHIDDAVRKALSAELMAKGIRVLVARNKKEFEKYTANKSPSTIVINNTVVDVASKYVTTSVKKHLIVYSLYDKIDKNIDLHFDTTSHSKKIKEGYRVFIFDCKGVSHFSVEAVDYFVSMALSERKYNVTLCFCDLDDEVVFKELKIRLRKGGIKLFADLDTILANKQVLAIAEASKNRQSGLTKELVSKLPLVVNAAVDTFESLTGGSAKKVNHKITTLEVDSKESLMASSIGFEGDVDGMIGIVFSKPLAQEIMLGMFGEEIDDEDEIVDVLREFANIVAGRTKTLMQEQNVHINIEIPNSYKSYTELQKIVGERQGVLIYLTLNEKPIYIFLTGKR